MRVVVFGGSGFLGSHVADYLSESGHKTIVFDAQSSPWLRSDQEMVCGDILDRDNVFAAVKDSDIVFHLAGVADIGQAAKEPYHTLNTNIIGSANIIEACVQHGVKRLMFASSVYVYSNKGAFYRVSKQAVEAALEVYNEKFGLEYTILRYGSLYGPRAQNWNGLKCFVEQGIRNKKIVYPGSGEERREYIHVKDAAKMTVESISSEYINKCLTLTGSQVMTTKEAMKIIREIADFEIDIEFKSEGQIYQNSHYGVTPYRYTPKQGKKIVPSSFIDIGEGILEVIEEVYQELDSDNNIDIVHF